MSASLLSLLKEGQAGFEKGRKVQGSPIGELPVSSSPANRTRTHHNRKRLGATPPGTVNGTTDGLGESVVRCAPPIRTVAETRLVLEGHLPLQAMVLTSGR